MPPRSVLRRAARPWDTASTCLFLLLLVPQLTLAKSPDSTVLNEWPMIMVHDAATTYLEGGLLHQVNNWAKTQPDGGAQGELNCGARAFDWRPAMSDGTVKAHHGDVTIDHPMAGSLDEMVAWCAANGTDPSELVVLGITDCNGDGCAAAVKTLLSARNITYITDCSELSSLTVGEAFKKAKLPNGGAILAIFDCWEENYDPSVACSGFGDKSPVPSDRTGQQMDTAQIRQAVSEAHIAEQRNLSEVTNEALTYTCYKDSSTKDFPVDRMKSYINKTTSAGPPSDGRLYTVQCLWQESASSVTVGELHGSTLLDDETRSGLNDMVNDMVLKKEIEVNKLNMVEVNNICDGGTQLLATLRAIN